MRVLMALAVAASLLLAGCMTYHAKPIDPAAAARSIEERSLEDPRLQEFIRAAQEGVPNTDRGVSAHWGLTTLTLAAIYFHPDLDIARSKLHEAQGAQVTARQVPNPSLSFEDMSFGPAPSGPSYTIAPVINFLIETGGRRTYRTLEQRARVKAAYSDLSTAFWRVRGELRDALLAERAARERVPLLQQRLALQEQIVTSIGLGLAVGEATSLELAREQLSRDQLRQSLADAERDAASSPARIAAAIGIPPDAVRAHMAEFNVFRERPPAPVLTMAQLQTLALTERSDLQGLLHEYSAAESALALEVARQYPNITLGPGYSFDSTQNRYLFMPELEVPLFNHNEGPIHEAIARREEVTADITALQVHIIASVDEGFATYSASLKSAESAAAAVEDSEAQEKRMEYALKLGEIDRPTLLAAKIETLATRQVSLETTIEVYRALGALEDATQKAMIDSVSLPSLDENPRLRADDVPSK